MTMGASRKPSIHKLRRDAEKHKGRLDSAAAGKRHMGPSGITTLRHCGRPTKDGEPCGRILQWYELACSIHATQPEQAAALDRLRADEWRAGR